MKMILVSAALSVMTAGAAPVVTDGKAVAAVRTGEHPTLAYAVQELTNWVEKISGAVLPVNPAEKTATEIYIGTPETSDEIAAFARANADDFTKLGKTDGFIIAEEGGFLGFGAKRIYIAGNRPKGALNGMYHFLTENTDLIFVRDMHADDGFGTIYGYHPIIANSIKKSVVVPSLTHHRHWRGTEPWQIRLGGNFPFYGSDTNALKRLKVHEVKNDVQDVAMSYGFGRVDKYKESDPDIFPLLPNGKRDFSEDHQICLMNPKTWDLYAKEIAQCIGWVPEGLGTRISLGLGDNWNLCTCKEHCMKDLKLEDGTVVKTTDKNFRSTQYAIMVNEVSHRLQKAHPGLKPVETGMYLFLTEAPAVLPDSMNSGCYCPYVKNHKKPVYDDSVNEQWHDRAEGFYKKGIKFESLYEYYLCTTTPQFYHGVCEVMQKDLKYYLAHGLTGCYIDTCAYDEVWHEKSDVWVLDVSAVEFWVAMKLMWNVDADIRALRREFCRRAYREAGETLGDFFEKLAANYNADPAGCYWNDDPISACNHYIVEKGLSQWARETLAKAEAEVMHPGSKELVSRLAGRMRHMIDKAEKMPKKLTYEVRQVTGGLKPDMDLEGAFWKDIAPLGPMTQISHADKPERAKTVVKIAHDLNNCYILAYFENKYYHEQMVKAEQAPKPKPTDEFQWATPCEIYFDGDYAPLGTYHFFSYMYNSIQKYTGKGPAVDPDAANRPWSVVSKSTLLGGKKGMISLMTFPMTTIGIDISKGNKCGFQFVSGGSGYWGCAWNGGQWHSPTGFQILRFEMK